MSGPVQTHGKKAALFYLATLCLAIVTAGSAHGSTLVLNSYGWSKVYELNGASTTGATTLVPPADLLNTTFLSESDRGPDGRVWGAGGSQLWAIDVSSSPAVWQHVSNVATIATDGLAWSPQGQLYLATLNELHQVNPATGATVPGTSLAVTKASGQLQLQSIAFSSTGTLYAADTSTLYTIDRTTGFGTPIYTAPLGDSHGIFIEIDYGSDGVLRALSYFDYIFSYDTTTHTGSWSPWKLSYNGSSFSPSSLASVPEPTSLGLLVLGLTIVAGRYALRKC